MTSLSHVKSKHFHNRTLQVSNILLIIYIYMYVCVCVKRDLILSFVYTDFRVKMAQDDVRRRYGARRY